MNTGGRYDQAAKLRTMFGAGQPQILAFYTASPKVGISTIIGHLAHVMARVVGQVVIVDESATSVYQLTPHVRARASTFDHHSQALAKPQPPTPGLIHLTDPRIKLIHAAPEITTQTQNGTASGADNFWQQITSMTRDYSIILVDCSHNLRSLANWSKKGQNVVVSTPSKQHVSDAYLLIKRLCLEAHVQHFNVLFNKVYDTIEAQQLLTNLRKVATSRLDVTIERTLTLPFDHQCAHAGAPLPFDTRSEFNEAIENLAGEVSVWHK